jgi:hypothetical protein
LPATAISVVGMGEKGLLVPTPGCSGITTTPGGLSLPIGCAPIPGNTAEWAVVNYTNWQVTPRDSLTLRSEFMNDENGQHTGVATRYLGVDLN